MTKPEWTMTDRIYLAVVDLARTDKIAFRIYSTRSTDGTLHAYCASVEKNPNQTQVAQRIYARAIADRLDGK